MLKRFVQIFGGDPTKRALEKYAPVVDQINALESNYENLTNEALTAKTGEFRARLAQGEMLDDLLVEAFAAVREASKRSIGLRHFDVQLIGGIALHQGHIAEMRTGEGKTLVATMPLYLNALAGQGVHLITVNDYLARRDARWMAPIFSALGLTVGVLQMAARTENGKKAFLVDLEHTSPHEDQHQLVMVPRQDAYLADITYGTNSEFGFDYLRDNMTMQWDDRVQRGHYYAIVDEVDNVLIDEARTPLIISGPAQDEAEWYIRMAQVVKSLRSEDFEISERDHTITLTEIGEVHVEELLGTPLRDPDRPEDVTLEQARLLGYLEQGLRAQHLFRRNKDYLVQGGKVVIIDEFTGRLMPGRRWSDGLHQAVEAKEGVKVQSESVTYATITIQNYFRMYQKLAGMTGTAATEAEEFDKIYKLEVVIIPTNLEYQALRTEQDLEIVDAKDEEGYKFRYYTRTNDPEKKPVFFQRKDYPDMVYRTEEAKLRSVAGEILRYHVLGRPMLVGTTSVELSERVSNRLRAEPLKRLTMTLLLREAWMKANNREEDGRLIEELQFLNTPLMNLDIAEMRKMARDLGLVFNVEDPGNLNRLLPLLNIPEGDPDRLAADLRAGIPHQVLNARKHTEESQIIAGAGAYGAVTIATNMAGRGVDIKLGGELAEEIIAAVNRVLNRNGHPDPYDMTQDERYAALKALDPAAYGIYESEIRYFLQDVEEMDKVRVLGGLHVIGSERHEARRIDNQLRGRSARQGDPGSSRFYLSMEDELMRLFGGSQADSLMQRLKIDDALPLEVGIVGRIVEQSQTRVEGANFDIRKHLLEYDDVLNTQRIKIYGQRDRIFEKEDLSEDATEMLRAEVTRRVQPALADEDGPWKLLSWLDQVQPPLSINGYIFPSFSLRLLLDAAFNSAEAEGNGQPVETLSQPFARQMLLRIVEDSLQSEENHLLHTIQTLLRQTEQQLDLQLSDRLDVVSTFFEGIRLADETDTRRPVELANDLSATVRLPLKLSVEQQRALTTDPDQVEEEVRAMVESSLTSQAVVRLVGSVERRLEEPLEIDPAELTSEDWNTLSETVISAVQALFERRRERYLGSSGQIVRDLDNALSRMDGPITRNQFLHLLILLPEGARAIFDKKTHRRMWQRTTRLTYLFYISQLLSEQPPQHVSDDVLDHLEKAQATMRRAWGMVEFNRLSAILMADLDEPLRLALQQLFGDERYPEIQNEPLGNLPLPEKEIVIDELGRRALTAIYRPLMLGVATELWVDYLTQMESLRVSIGLEAYGQRDPLVQYKNRAFELFQQLLDNMRMGVVSRMFTYRPREASSAPASPGRSDAPAMSSPVSAQLESGDDGETDAGNSEEEEDVEAVSAPSPTSKQPAAKNVSTSKKRRRRRH